MFNVGGGEVLVILVLALVVLGPDKLPQAAKTVGKHLADFRRISNGFRQEITDAMDLGAFTESSTPSTDAAPQPAPAASTAPTVRVETSTEPAPSDTDGSFSTPVHADGPVESFA